MATAVAAIDFVILADLVIDFYVKLPKWKMAQHHLAEVRIREHRTVHVRFRIQVDDRLPDGINLVRRNHVGRFKWSTRASVVRIAGHILGIEDIDLRLERQQFRKVSLPHQICWHVAFQICGVILAPLLDIEEEERLVTNNRPAYSKPILIAHMIGFFRGVKEVLGIKFRTLSVPPPGTMKPVAALP